MHRQNGWPTNSLTKICVFWIYWNDSIFSDMEIKINVLISFIIFCFFFGYIMGFFYFIFYDLPSAQKYIFWLEVACSLLFIRFLLSSYSVRLIWFPFCCAVYSPFICLSYNYLSPKLTRKLANFFFFHFYFCIFLKCWFLLYCNFVQNCRNFLYINCYIYLYYYYYRYFI